MEYVTTLRAGRDIDPNVASDTSDAELRSEHELGVGDEDFRVQVLAVALESGIVGNVEQNVDVAARTTARSSISDAAQCHVLTRRNAGRNLDVQLLVIAQTSFATTLLARRLYDLPFSVACRTRRHGDELPEERSLRTTDFARAMTRSARLRLRARLGPAAVAPIARIENLHADLLIDARRDFGQRERDRDLDVGAAPRSGALARAAAEHLL